MSFSNTISAEQVLIGCILRKPELFEKASNLTPEMFADLNLKNIFYAMRELDKNGNPIDPLTVSNILGVNYRALIVECIDSAPSTLNFESYCEIVFEEWRQHIITQRAQEVAISGKNADDMLAELSKIIDEQNQVIGQKRNLAERTFIEAMGELWVNLFKEDTSIKTEWSYLNKILGGFQRGGLYVIAARPGDGKTDFAIMLATQLSKKYAVDFISLEMPIEQLAQRILSRVCKINSRKMRDHELTEEDQKKIGYVTDQMANLHLILDDNTRISVVEIEKKILSHKPDLIIIDYLSRIKFLTENNIPQWQAIGETTRELKSLALKYKCVILVLAQLNRIVDKQGIPSLSDLRGSGDIEADADGVMFLRPQKTDTFLSGDEFWKVDLMIKKNRHGGTGNIELNWWPQYHDYSIVTNIYDGG